MAAPNIITQWRYAILKVPTTDGSKFLYYLLDNDTKRLSNFMSQEALLPYAKQYGLITPQYDETMFKADAFDPAEMVWANIIPPELFSNLVNATDENGKLVYKLDPKSYIDTTGKYIDHNYNIDDKGLTSMYGATTLDTASYAENAKQVMTVLRTLRDRAAKYGTQQSYGLQSQFIDRFLEEVDPNNPNHDPNAVKLLNKLVLSQTYGGYTDEDVVRELLRQQFVTSSPSSDERNRMAWVELISNTQNADTFKATDAYKTTLSGNVFQLPWSELLSSTAYKLPEEFFQFPEVAKQENIWNNVKEAMATMVDLQYDMISAWDQQAYDMAKGSYNKFKQDLEYALGIQLSDDMETAWWEVAQLAQSASDANLGNSGIHREALDKLLSKKQELARRTTKSAQDQEDSAEKEYYTKTATMEEILAFAQTEEGKRKLAEWWMVQWDADRQYIESLQTMKNKILNDNTLPQAQKDILIQELDKIINYAGKDGYRNSAREQDTMLKLREQFVNTVNDIYSLKIAEASNDEEKQRDQDIIDAAEKALIVNTEGDVDTTKNQTDGATQQITELMHTYNKLGGATSYQDLINKYQSYTANQINALTWLTQDQKNLLFATKQYNWSPTAPDTATTWNKTIGVQDVAPFSNEATTIVKDQIKTQLAGGLKTDASWTPPAGTERISGPSQLWNYTNIVTAPNGIDKYGVRKTTTVAPITPTTYTPQSTGEAINPYAPKTTTYTNTSSGASINPYSNTAPKEWTILAPIAPPPPPPPPPNPTTPPLTTVTTVTGKVVQYDPKTWRIY